MFRSRVYKSKSFLIVNEVKIYQFKATYSRLNAYRLFLGSISKDFTGNNI